MRREYKAYIKDILESIGRIEKYTEGMNYAGFAKDKLVQDGVARNLEIIGESVKNIPETVKEENPEIEWKKIAGLRDILIHAYFGIDASIIWNVVKSKLPELKEKVSELQ
jgi:uncharacterized protein with HEPN domain